jgi:hypothetical protein
LFAADAFAGADLPLGAADAMADVALGGAANAIFANIPGRTAMAPAAGIPGRTAIAVAHDHVLSTTDVCRAAALLILVTTTVHIRAADRAASASRLGTGAW